MHTFDAGAAMRRLRILLRARQIDTYALAVADALLFSAGRRYGEDMTAPAALTRLAKLARQSKQRLVDSLVQLERAGVLQRVRHRLLVITATGGRIWRQMASRYRLLVRESALRTDSEPQMITAVVMAVANKQQEEAQEDLRRVREARARTLGLMVCRG